MKHLILFLASLYCAVTAAAITTITADDNSVYTVIGDPLLAGQDYYVVPYNYGDVGGGLTWKLKQELLAICPHYYVLQVEDNLNFGEPTAFFPSNSRQNQITLSNKLNILFSKVSPPASPPFVCPASSNVWKVVADDSTGIVYVELGGRKGRSRDTNSWFTIEELDEGGYQIKYCDSTKRKTASVCGGLGIVSLNGGRYLGVNATNPVAFAFETQQIFVKTA
ncbi:hypothetical protein BVRB_8g188700 [Beta vulgaris subsp. vulgaris]|uniref:miraculin n=1 Tax=Beta vulgaris subsp. vulgaris TaxID=3555 RepID=UPI00053F98AC|nr:miraculin [Beta vulgaris subsp. vulgaris]KMT03721.1 hypothetical protein BVRB_8g188700 [Beta vulgaris subsp. vulgaris]